MTHDPAFFFFFVEDLWKKQRNTADGTLIANNCQVIFDKKRTKKFVICCDNMNN